MKSKNLKSKTRNIKPEIQQLEIWNPKSKSLKYNKLKSNNLTYKTGNLKYKNWIPKPESLHLEYKTENLEIIKIKAEI